MYLLYIHIYTFSIFLCVCVLVRMYSDTENIHIVYTYISHICIMHMQEHYQHIFSRKDVDGQIVIDEAKLKNFAGILFYVRRDSFICVTALID